jgi:hypothetical protein
MNNEGLIYSKKFFFMEMKNTLINYNSQIISLMNDNKNLSIFYNSFDLIEKNSMKEENTNFLKSLKSKIDNNKYLISLIDDFLKENCQHEIMEDYIEGGVEKEMIKIKYCKHCEISF